ncbi:MAG: hypothetical protein JW725_04710 [Candidatus Babeliaceae bacterium]|nr:hypothetical protein [Candidatus Babeliaceae bacterium]
MKTIRSKLMTLICLLGLIAAPAKAGLSALWRFPKNHPIITLAGVGGLCATIWYLKHKYWKTEQPSGKEDTPKNKNLFEEKKDEHLFKKDDSPKNKPKNKPTTKTTSKEFPSGEKTTIETSKKSSDTQINPTLIEIFSSQKGRGGKLTDGFKNLTNASKGKKKKRKSQQKLNIPDTSDEVIVPQHLNTTSDKPLLIIEEPTPKGPFVETPISKKQNEKQEMIEKLKKIGAFNPLFSSPEGKGSKLFEKMKSKNKQSKVVKVLP